MRFSKQSLRFLSPSSIDFWCTVLFVEPDLKKGALPSPYLCLIIVNWTHSWRSRQLAVGFSQWTPSYNNYQMPVRPQPGLSPPPPYSPSRPRHVYKKSPFRNLNQVGKEVGRKDKVLQLTGPNCKYITTYAWKLWIARWVLHICFSLPIISRGQSLIILISSFPSGCRDH